MLFSLRSASVKRLRIWWDIRRGQEFPTGSRFRSWLLDSAERPFSSALHLLLAFLSATFLALFLSSQGFDSWAQAFTGISNVIPRLSIESLLKTADNLLQGQAALAALSFPIAIAFAAFSQDRERRSTTLEIYFVESGALLLATSSLFLIVSCISVGSILGLPSIPPLRQSFSWQLATYLTVWMVVNVCGTGYFIYKTYEFLGRDGRRTFLTTYAVQAVRSRDVLSQVMTTLFTSDVLTTERSSYLRFDQGYENESYRPIRLIFSSRNQLYDIRPLPLKWIIDRWSRRHPNKDNPALLPLLDLQSASRDFVVISAPSDRPFSKIEVAIIKRCFVFRRAGRSANFLRYAEYFSTIVGEINSALERDDYVDYEYHVETLAILMRIALGSGLETSSHARAGDRAFSAIRPGASLFDLLRPAMIFTENNLIPNRIERNGRYLNTIIRALSEFLHFEPSVAGDSTKVMRDTFAFLVWINETIEKAWLKRRYLEESMTGESVEVLSEPTRSNFENVVIEVIGHWESTLKFDLSWEYARSNSLASNALCEALLNHCASTVQSFFSATIQRDRVAASWWLDSHARWVSGFTYSFDRNADIGSEQVWVSTSNLESRETRVDVTEFGDGERDYDKYLILRNFWWESRLVVVSFLIRRVERKQDKDIAASLLQTALKGDTLHPGSYYPDEDVSLSQPRKVLAYLLRILNASNKIEGFLIDELSEASLEIRHGTMIPGRGYSWEGASDRAINIRTGAALLCYGSNGEWSTNSEMEDAIYDWLRVNDLRNDGLRSLEAVRRSLDSFNGSMLEEIFIWMPVSVEQWGVRIEMAKRGVELLRQRIVADNQNEVLALPVSEARLAEIEDACSLEAFTKATADKTVKLFAQVEVRPFLSDEEVRRFKVSSISRATVVDREDPNRPINEKSWFTGTTRNYVGAQLMWSMYNLLVGRSVTATTEEIYAKQLIEQSLSYGDRELLLLTSNETIPAWIWEWRYPSSDGVTTPDGIVITRIDSRNRKNLEFVRINGVNVVRAPVKATASLLVPEAAFVSVFFEQFENGKLVKASWEADPADPLIGTLTISWKPRFRIEAGSGIELVHTNKPDEAE